jgi:3-hydroxyisobutyrate dehydrogenase-like beta-hydroxyacid dehydrogenase
MERPVVIGLLYPGEMGVALAGLLCANGGRVVTTLQGRGEKTVRRCREAGLTVLDSLGAVAREADVVMSVVPPAAARDVADAWCRVAHESPRRALYVDANSIGPELAGELASRVERCGRGFVDAAVNGLAVNAAASGTLFLSGPRAGEVAALFSGAMSVQELGARVGAASAMKMLLGGLSKGLCGLFLELALLAREQGMLPEMLQACGRIYPGVTAVTERMLPTYALHAGRRATEMAEVEQTVRAAGLAPCVTRAVRELHQAMAAVSFGLASEAGAAGLGWTPAAVIEHLAKHGLLSGPVPAAHADRFDATSASPVTNATLLEASGSSHGR